MELPIGRRGSSDGLYDGSESELLGVMVETIAKGEDCGTSDPRASIDPASEDSGRVPEPGS